MKKRIPNSPTWNPSIINWTFLKILLVFLLYLKNQCWHFTFEKIQSYLAFSVTRCPISKLCYELKFRVQSLLLLPVTKIFQKLQNYRDSCKMYEKNSHNVCATKSGTFHNIPIKNSSFLVPKIIFEVTETFYNIPQTRLYFQWRRKRRRKTTLFICSTDYDGY